MHARDVWIVCVRQQEIPDNLYQTMISLVDFGIIWQTCISSVQM